MTELTKLARAEWMADTLDADDCYINLRINAHHAAEKAKAFILRNDPTGACVGHNRIIAALDALILTPPVDPLVASLNHVLATGNESQMADWLGENAAEIRRGLELREGGGA